MGELGEILGFGLQGRKLVEILRERMDGADRSAARRPSFKERLGLKGLGCCGPTWGLGPTTMSVRGDDDEEEENGPPLSPQIEVAHSPTRSGPIPPCLARSPAAGMNLAAALAAERQLRAALEFDIAGVSVSPNRSPGPSPPRPNSFEGRSPGPGTPGRVSLMRLLEETDGCDGGMKREGEGEGESDPVCCVCMGRKKGAAFIPCGHTFCRVCSRELWLNRGSCPLCNRPILEILDIY